MRPRIVGYHRHERARLRFGVRGDRRSLSSWIDGQCEESGRSRNAARRRAPHAPRRYPDPLRIAGHEVLEATAIPSADRLPVLDEGRAQRMLGLWNFRRGGLRKMQDGIIHVAPHRAAEPRGSHARARAGGESSTCVSQIEHAGAIFSIPPDGCDASSATTIAHPTAISE